MTERELLRELTRQVKKLYGVHWNKLGDTFGGHKKPYDVDATYEERSYYLEFKKGKPDLEEHQREALTSGYNAGAITYVCCFIKNEELRHERDVMCYPVIAGEIETKHFFRLGWRSGKYTHLEIFFDNLRTFFILSKGHP